MNVNNKDHDDWSIKSWRHLGWGHTSLKILDLLDLMLHSNCTNTNLEKSLNLKGDITLNFVKLFWRSKRYKRLSDVFNLFGEKIGWFFASYQVLPNWQQAANFLCLISFEGQGTY